MIELSHERDDHNLDNMGSAKDLNRKAFFLVASSTCCIEATFETVFIFFLSSFLGRFFENHVLCGYMLLRGRWTCLGVVSSGLAWFGVATNRAPRSAVVRTTPAQVRSAPAHVP